MSWLAIYIIGLFLTSGAAGLLCRGKTLKDDDLTAIYAGCLMWPLPMVFAAIILAIGLVCAPPVLLFTLCKGDLDDEIKIATKWCKTTWNSIGH